jgi:hypothetical protein
MTMMKIFTLSSVLLLSLILGCNANPAVTPAPTATDELNSSPQANGEIVAQLTLETVSASNVNAARLEDEGILLEAVGRTAGGKAFNALLIVSADTVSGWKGASVQLRANRVVTGGVPALVGTVERSKLAAGFVLVDEQSRLPSSEAVGSTLEMTDVLVSSFSFGASNPSTVMRTASGSPFSVGTGLLSPSELAQRPASMRPATIPDGTSNTLGGKVRVIDTNIGVVGRIVGSLGRPETPAQSIIAILIGVK